MLGLVKPRAGKVMVLGENPGAAVQARAQIGYLPESVALQPTMTGEEFLAFYARIKRRRVSDNPRILERVGIAGVARHRIGTYSKGMRQRLALAQALIGDPRVLLLDEPTTGLDPALRQTFYEIVGDLRMKGVTVLLSTHALNELEGQVDRVVVMNQGRKVADGTIADLRRLARRPARIRLTLQDDLVTPFPRVAGMGFECHRVDARRFDIHCAEQEKVNVVRRITDGALPVADIEITSPTLDDVYAHFLNAEAAE